MKRHDLLYIAAAFVFCSQTNFAAGEMAPVSGFARSFLSGEVIANAKITILETGKEIRTDSDGHFGPFNYPIGQPITLILSKDGYISTQSATIIVPPTGLTDKYDNISFQVASIYAYYFLAAALGQTEDPNACHVFATITAYHKTMDDDPQGEPDATVTITPAVNSTPFYFDIFKSGPLKGKTYPFPTGITQTSEDGGVAFFNLPVRDEPYRISAMKAGVTFTEASFLCHKGMLINISPPHGPMANEPY